MNTSPSQIRPLDDIDIRLEETADGVLENCGIEFATFAEGEYVESIILNRIRARELYDDLGRVLGLQGANAADGQTDSNRSSVTTASPSDAETQEVPVCPECGSENVAADAAARWSRENGDWEVSNIFDKGHGCDDCEAQDFEFEWVKKNRALA